jgi:hypothetical protein
VAVAEAVAQWDRSYKRFREIRFGTRPHYAVRAKLLNEIFRAAPNGHGLPPSPALAPMPFGRSMEICPGAFISEFPKGIKVSTGSPAV